MAPRISQTAFDRALALLDGDDSLSSASRAPIEQHDNGRGTSESSTNPTTPSRRRNRTSPTSPSPASPLRDYLSRHSIQLGQPAHQRSPVSSQRTADLDTLDHPNQTPRRTQQRPRLDPQDPFIDETTQAAASLYVIPRRPLRSSIFESSPRRWSEGQPETDPRSRGDRKTSATLRYALEATPARDTTTSGRSRRPPAPERTRSDSPENSQMSQGQTSFLDVEADPPTELDERFPAIEPAASSSVVQQHVDESRHAAPTQTQTVDDDIWLEPSFQYHLPRHVHTTPPELVSVRGISVEQLQAFVQQRNESQKPDSERPAVSPPAQKNGEALHGWETGMKVGHDSMPLSRRDLEAAVETLQEDMRTIRQQLGAVTTELVARSRPGQGRAQSDEAQSHVLQAILEIDALVHHVPPGKRDQAEVLTQDNLKIITNRIREWEGVVRDRSSVTTLAGVAQDN